MTKLVLKEGGFYITRDGRKVGPMVEEKLHRSDWPWDVKNGEGDLSTMLWEDDGTADESTDADLIEEWKEESVLVEKVEEPQEDDEWGPWTEDFRDFLSSDAQILVEFSGIEYIRHRTKKPVAKKQIEVGGSYVSNNGQVYKCIYMEGDKAWMKASTTGTAYVWTLDGVSLSLNETYNIDFTQDPEYDRVPF